MALSGPYLFDIATTLKFILVSDIVSVDDCMCLVRRLIPYMAGHHFASTISLPLQRLTKHIVFGWGYVDIMADGEPALSTTTAASIKPSPFTNEPGWVLVEIPERFLPTIGTAGYFTIFFCSSAALRSSTEYGKFRSTLDEIPFVFRTLECGGDALLWSTDYGTFWLK